MPTKAGCSWADRDPGQDWHAQAAESHTRMAERPVSANGVCLGGAAAEDLVEQQVVLVPAGPVQVVSAQQVVSVQVEGRRHVRSLRSIARATEAAVASVHLPVRHNQYVY